MAEKKRKRCLKSDYRTVTDLQKPQSSDDGSHSKVDHSQSSPTTCFRQTLFTKMSTGRSLVAGRLRFKLTSDTDADEPIDCSKFGTSPLGVLFDVDDIVNVESDALFILLVEECGARGDLLDTKFFDRIPCIILTSGGPTPNKLTGLFLKKLHTVLKLPVLALVECTHRGMRFLLAYGRGSENEYGTADRNLATPDIKWLGLRPTDWDKYPVESRLKMAEKDVKLANDMLNDEIVKKSPDWVAELYLMLKTREKALICKLSPLDPSYLTDVYLPQKLEQEDWK